MSPKDVFALSTPPATAWRLSRFGGAMAASRRSSWNAMSVRMPTEKHFYGRDFQ